MTTIVADADVANDDAAGINTSPYAPPEAATVTTSSLAVGKKQAPPILCHGKENNGRCDDDNEGNDGKKARRLHRRQRQRSVAAVK